MKRVLPILLLIPALLLSGCRSTGAPFAAESFNSGTAATETLAADPAQTDGAAESTEAQPYVLCGKVPVFMYHEVSDEGTNSLYCAPSEFQAQLDFFEENGITPVTMAQLYDNWENGLALPEKPVVLTFDDGYRSMYTTVLPMLEEKGFVATFYVVTGSMENPNALTADMIREMSDAGMEIGSHTVSHLDLTILDEQTARSEIADSKATLEALTGKPVTSFCYPAGEYNDELIGLVQEAGYHTAVTTTSGYAMLSDGLFSLTRLRVSRGDGTTNIYNNCSYVGYFDEP